MNRNLKRGALLNAIKTSFSFVSIYSSKHSEPHYVCPFPWQISVLMWSCQFGPVFGLSRDASTGVNTPSPNTSEPPWWRGGMGKGEWSFQFIFFNSGTGKVPGVRSA